MRGLMETFRLIAAYAGLMEKEESSRLFEELLLCEGSGSGR